ANMQAVAAVEQQAVPAPAPVAKAPDAVDKDVPVPKANIKPAPMPALAEDKSPPTKSQVFIFDGKSRIVTPLERFAPVTLEAWFRPSRDSRRRGDRAQYLIGSDIPNQYGYGIGIRYDGNVLGGLQMETLRTFYNSNTPIAVTEWSHVAAVF